MFPWLCWWSRLGYDVSLSPCTWVNSNSGVLQCWMYAENTIRLDYTWWSLKREECSRTRVTSALCLLEVLSCFFFSTFVPLHSTPKKVSVLKQILYRTSPVSYWWILRCVLCILANVELCPVWTFWIILRRGRWGRDPSKCRMFERSPLGKTQSIF